MKCPACGSERLVHDHCTGEVKCENCGLVVETIVDTGQEWRAYDEEQRLARARAEPVKPAGRLVTLLGPPPPSGAGRRYEFARLAALHASVVEEARSVEAGAREISRLTAALQLPHGVREEAQRLFRLAQKNGLLRGSTVAAVAAACVLLACREFGLPSPLARLLQYTSADVRKVRRSYMELRTLLGGRVVVKADSPLKYVPMIASKLGLGMEVQKMAADIIRTAEEGRLLLGKPPRSCAAAALYIATVIHGRRPSRHEIAQAAGITETTLRKRVKDLLRKLDFEAHV